ncbi:nicotinate phosphoribosyltransferase, partial [Candidatus Aerophobetes bacterium]|nr:nicotinate phosphoribosyltransferase [Candidatus Aerophobetes bacterium]
EVRWELDLRGFDEVKLFVSGGIDEEEISQLDQVADAFGVGTWISNAPVIDFALDIVEVEGRPYAKKGKCSGKKEVWRCPSCYSTLILPRGKRAERCSCGGEMLPLLQPMVEEGKIIKKIPNPFT